MINYSIDETGVREYVIDSTNFDLHPIAFGERVCVPGFHRHYNLCRTYQLHYIVSGKGAFVKDGVAHHIHGGQLFISLPGEVYGTYADEVAPFHYIWLKLLGSDAERLSSLPTVITTDGTAMHNIVNCNHNSSTAKEYITAQTHLLMASLFDSRRGQSDHVTFIKNYINSIPAERGLKVEEIQRAANLNRQYMSALFKRQEGISIQQYIIRVRMEKAIMLLKQGFSVTETARLSGYESIYAFSKAFKRELGISPTEYLNAMET